MWIKICGVRDLPTAELLAELRPQAVGLNFYAKSPRCVTPAVAAQVVELLPGEVERVGVFVNQPVAKVLDLVEQCGLTAVQLHGDEPPDVLAELSAALRLNSPTYEGGAGGVGRESAGLRELSSDQPVSRAAPPCPPFGRGGAGDARIIRAWRMGDGGLQDLADYLDECIRQDALPWAVLVDSRVPGQYGGSGVEVPWERLRQEYRPEWPPLILAGGLEPANVADAVRRVHPWGIDTASGVESAPGIKDAAKLRVFIESARRAFADESARE